MSWQEKMDRINQALSRTSEDDPNYMALTLLRHGIKNTVNGRYPASFRTHTASILHANDAVDEAYQRLDQEFQRLFPQQDSA